MTREEIVLQNWQDVQSSLQSVCERTGRNPSEITLLAVTKYPQDTDVLTLLKNGKLTDIGESRVQQAWARWRENPAFAAYPAIQKHFIGHLQKNKAAKAAQLFDWVDSLDDMDTARILSTHTPPGKTLRVLVQIKLTDKVTQSGLDLPHARQLARQIKTAFNNLVVCGYMAVAPQGAPEKVLRHLFKNVKAAFDEDFKNTPRAQLSLGMSEDYLVALEEGSTLPRLGSLLFSRNLEGL